MSNESLLQDLIGENRDMKPVVAAAILFHVTACISAHGCYEGAHGKTCPRTAAEEKLASAIDAYLEAIDHPFSDDCSRLGCHAADEQSPRR